jgi:hypothetical protein
MVLQRNGVLWLVVPLLVLQIGCHKGQGLRGGPHPANFIFEAGICDPPLSRAANCSGGATGNTCTGSACNIGLSITGTSGVALTLNGQPLMNTHGIVCVDKNAAITWSTAPNTNFLLDFGNTAPLQNQTVTYVTGTDTNPANYTTMATNGCYKYNVKVCANVSMPQPSAITCGEIDPKVIIGDGN